MFLLLKCQVCIYYSNYPSHKYMDWTLILRSHIVIYLIHLLGQITPSIFHTVLKPNLLLRYLKAFRILVNNWHLFCAGLSLSITNAVAGPALMVLDTLRNNHQETGKKRLNTYRSCKLHNIPGATQWGQGERDRKNAWALGFCFYWSRGSGPRVSELTLLVNLKHREGISIAGLGRGVVVVVWK